MIDAKGRMVDHLRISLTNRCNLDCFYCHKEGNGDTLQEMNSQHVMKILEEAKMSGIKTIKFTGGEPLLRNDIFEIIRYSKLLGFGDISLTTNGTLLKRHAENLKRFGLERVNIGCDSLTGILPKNTERLLEGILAAKRSGLGVKLNMVVLKGLNHKEIFPMIRFSIKNDVNLQLIELVECDSYDKYYYSLQQLEFGLMRIAEKVESRDMQRRVRFHFGRIFVEIVRPRKEFCEKCNKIRITADGRVRQCLMKDTGIIDFKDRDSFGLAVRLRDHYGYD